MKHNFFVKNKNKRQKPKKKKTQTNNNTMLPDCKLSISDCTINCDINGESFKLPSQDKRVPSLIRAQYRNCRNEQKTKVLNIFEHRSKVRQAQCSQQDDPKFMSLLKENERENLRENLKNQLKTNGNVIFSKLLGKGVHGAVIEICGSIAADFPQNIVVKTSLMGKSCRPEFRKQVYFAKVGLAPTPTEPYASHMPFFIMGKIDGTVGNLLQYEMLDAELNDVISASIQLLFRMCDHNMVHGDLHFGNIAYVIDPQTKKKVYLCLDFSEAVVGCEPEIDLLQLIRDTFNSFYHPYNRKYLQKHLREIYKINYGPLTETTLAQISKKRLKLIDAHQKHINSVEQGTSQVCFQELIDSEDDDTEAADTTDEGDDDEDDEDTEENNDAN